MRIIEVNGEKYHVVKEISSKDEEFLEKLKSLYDERYSDFVLLRAVPNPAVEEHHLICRKIEDAVLEP